MPRGRYQQKQWEQREEAILAALEQLSAERGFVQVTMDDLADAVGISKATLYQHFESKDALLARLIGRRADEFLIWLDNTASASPKERLRQTMRYLVENQTSPMRDVFNTSDMRPVLHSSPDLIAQHRRIVQRLFDVIRQGQADGVITTAAAPDVIIRAMWALSSAAAHQDPVFSEELPASDTAVDQMIALFERAVQR